VQDHPPEPEHPPLAELHFPGNNRESRMVGKQPCSSHPWKLTNYAQQKLEGSSLQWDKWVVFHTSYLIVMNCHLLSVSATVVLTLVFTIGLAETTPADWSHSFYLLFSISFRQDT
jgi:hypothetical protein